MHIGKTISFLCLSTAGLAFKIRAFSGSDCTGSAQEVNVWDNTCRDSNVPKTKSFRVLAYGAGRQRAHFWAENNCAIWVPDDEFRDWWADGGSDTFIKNRCITLPWEAKAYSSISA